MGVLNRAAVASVRLGAPGQMQRFVLSISFFQVDIFFIVGQKGGGGFYVGFLKMEQVYFMAHPSGWLIRQDGT